MTNNNYTLLLSRQAQKFLDKTDPQNQQRLIAMLELLSEDPYQGKELIGPLKGRYSWRVGPYRIIYRINKQQLQVTIIAIDHRKKVFDRF